MQHLSPITTGEDFFLHGVGGGGGRFFTNFYKSILVGKPRNEEIK
jgi:hypothetical protein